MPRAARALLIVIAMGGGVASAAPDTAVPAADRAHVVRYRDDKLTVDLHDTSIATAMAEVARESGAELVGTPREERRLTIAFEEVPLNEALERLVGAQNFTLKYDDAGKLKAIELRGGQEARDAGRTGQPAPDPTTAAKQYAFFKAFDRNEPVELTGDLRQKLHQDRVAWDTLGNVALAAPDPRIRQAAMRALLQALDRDPEMKAAVRDSLSAMTTEELAAFARARAYHMAEGLVRDVLRESSDPDVRSRARDVLRELHNNPFKGPRPQPH